MTFLTIVEQMLSSEEINKCKKGRTVRVTVRDTSRKANHLSKLFEYSPGLSVSPE